MRSDKAIRLHVRTHDNDGIGDQQQAGAVQLFCLAVPPEQHQ